MSLIIQRVQRLFGLLFLFIQKQDKHARVKELLRDGRLIIGKHSYGTPYIDTYKGNDEDRVIIGAYCSISNNVTMMLGGIHPANWVSLYPFRAIFGLPGAFQDGMPLTKGDIEVGSDVWIGTGAMILSGVKIGHGAVVATRAVVTKDVPPFSIVGGIPAAVIKYRFSENQIASLLAIKWWEWTEIKIREEVKLLSSPNIDDFIQRHRFG